MCLFESSRYSISELFFMPQNYMYLPLLFTCRLLRWSTYLRSKEPKIRYVIVPQTPSLLQKHFFVLLLCAYESTIGMYLVHICDVLSGDSSKLVVVTAVSGHVLAG